jgi:hypothetical protein
MNQNSNTSDVGIDEHQNKLHQNKETLGQLSQQVWSALFSQSNENYADDDEYDEEYDEMSRLTVTERDSNEPSKNMVENSSLNNQMSSIIDQVKLEIKENQKLVDDQLTDQLAWADQIAEKMASQFTADLRSSENTDAVVPLAHAENINDTNSNVNNEPSSTAVASALSTILQRCQSSIDGDLAQQIDDTMIHELEDEEEIMRNAAMPDENETDNENVEDEFMEDDDFLATEKALNTSEVNSNSLAFERGLQRLRELKRRHVSHSYTVTDNNNNSSSTANKQNYAAGKFFSNNFRTIYL